MKSLWILSLGLCLAPVCLAQTADRENRQFAQRGPDYIHPRITLAAQSDARGMDFDVYIRLQTGMSEGELLLRAGKPDSESVENTRNDIVKTYYYFPTTSNPWITTITLRAGKIANIERTKKTF